MRRFAEKQIMEMLETKPSLSRRYWTFMRKRIWPPTSWEYIEREGRENPLPDIFAALIECRCSWALRQNHIDVSAKMREMCHGELPQDEGQWQGLIKHAVRAVAKRYASKRRCHTGIKSVTCYCGEIGHGCGDGGGAFSPQYD